MKKEKLYFLDEDDEFCLPLSIRLEEAREEGLTEITLFEAIPDKHMKEFVYCRHEGEITETSDCRKHICPYYDSKSGRGVCRHRGKLYLHGDQKTFKC